MPPPVGLKHLMGTDFLARPCSYGQALDRFLTVRTFPDSAVPSRSEEV